MNPMTRISSQEAALPRDLRKSLGNSEGNETWRIRKGRGFTLLEMLAVIVLIAIATSLTAVSLRHHHDHSLQATAQQIAAALRDTRTKATASSKAQWFSIDMNQHVYTTPDRDTETLSKSITLHSTSAAVVGAQTGVAKFVFFPDGCSSGGNITLSESHHSVRIDVDWLTGMVTVSKTGAS